MTESSRNNPKDNLFSLEQKFLTTEENRAYTSFKSRKQSLVEILKGKPIGKATKPS